MGLINLSLTNRGGGHRVIVEVEGVTVVTPPLEHTLFYAGLGALAVAEIVEWPLALLLMGGHILMDATNRPGLNALGEALDEA